MSDHANHPDTHTTAHVEHTHHEVGPWQIIVESDLLNVVILAAAIIYAANKFLPKAAAERKKQISKELEAAKEARVKAEEELAKIKDKCKNISSEIDEIKSDAKKTASGIQTRIEEDTKADLEKLKVKTEKEISTAQEKAIQNIKESATSAAMQLAEEALVKIADDPTVQEKIIDDFLDEMEKPSKN